MPKDSTTDDIVDAYTTGWQLGLKCLAIYRDGSKRTQPLNTKSRRREEASDAKIEELASAAAQAAGRAQAITHKFSIAGHDGYLTVGCTRTASPAKSS